MKLTITSASIRHYANTGAPDYSSGTASYRADALSVADRNEYGLQHLDFVSPVGDYNVGDVIELSLKRTETNNFIQHV